jgi:hypothetical protein
MLQCAPDLFSPHALDPTRRHPHRRRRRSRPFARRHGYCTAVVLCVAAMSLRSAGRQSAPAPNLPRILQVGVFGGSGESTYTVFFLHFS